MNMLLVTNNPMVHSRYQNEVNIELLETDLHGVMIHTRNLVHKGHKLLTHPLSGSVKPNETIYKSILLSGVPESTDMQSVNIIEESIQTAQKFPHKHISEQHFNDMQTVDLTLIQSALYKG